MSTMWPTPVCWGFSPVSSAAREGQHLAELYIWEKRRPFIPSRSRFGVRISDPKQPMSEYPMSSTRITMMLGLSAIYKSPVVVFEAFWNAGR